MQTLTDTQNAPDRLLHDQCSTVDHMACYQSGLSLAGVAHGWLGHWCAVSLLI